MNTLGRNRENRLGKIVCFYGKKNIAGSLNKVEIAGNERCDFSSRILISRNCG